MTSIRSESLPFKPTATPQSTSNDKPNPDELLKLKEVYTKMKVSRSTFWKCRNEYNLPVITVGGTKRIRASVLDAWLERRTIVGKGKAKSGTLEGAPTTTTEVSGQDHLAMGL